MAIPLLDRRKFVRLDVNLESCLDYKIRGVVKTLSLGGCSIETETPIHIKNPVYIEIFLEGESFKLWGDILCSPKETSYSIRFNHPTNEQNLWLIKVIENINKTPTPLRPIRASLQGIALLDRESALITDISERGCFIQTSASFKYDDIVEVKFIINEEEMYLAGQVIWVGPRGIGIEFLSPDPTQISTISRYVSLQASPPLASS